MLPTIEQFYEFSFKFVLKQFWKEYQVFICRDASMEGSISTGEVDDSVILQQIRTLMYQIMNNSDILTSSEQIAYINMHEDPYDDISINDSSSDSSSDISSDVTVTLSDLENSLCEYCGKPEIEHDFYKY